LCEKEDNTNQIKMRRSGSSSCMLRSKQESIGEPLSVTILNTKKLPTYSSERFYVLSELETNGHSTVFLREHDHENETRETEESSSTTSDHNRSTAKFPSFIILYVLWTPETTARVFAEVLMETIHQLEAAVDIMPSREPRIRTLSSISLSSMALTDAPSSPQREVKAMESPKYIHQETTTIKPKESSPDRSSLDGHDGHSPTSGSSTKPNFDVGSKVYLVVDRVCPPLPAEAVEDPEAKQRHFQVQVDLAEHLARMVASHSKLRAVCEGITIGVANHDRAAPGLEACLDAVLVGAKDRRRVSANSKSWVGMVAADSDDFLGLQETDVTDAASGVLQSRVCAEWNGMGTLPTFSKRAHRDWRIAHDLPPEAPVHLSPRKRKRGSSSGQLDALSPADMFSTVLAVCFWVAISSYVWQNWRDLLPYFVVVDDKASLFYKPPEDSSE
jgi:hypothetical protein